MIPVTKSYVPSMIEYTSYLERAFNNGWLTNRGELVFELESRIKKEFGINGMIAMNNGTIPIQIALDIVGEGEVITTPFSYIATTSAILWQKLSPVFVDIDDSLTIDPSLIESKITDKTVAILGTHVFGNTCDITAIEKIASKHGIMVIYDAAHSFGVSFKGQSIFNFGDISTCSFHATKVFHSGEGGAYFSNDERLLKLGYDKHNFGHEGKESFSTIGINGKMSELNAAMGLTVLDNFDSILKERKVICDRYAEGLTNSDLKLLEIRDEVDWNYSYFPVIFKSIEQREKVVKLLNENNIFPRRYFYPSLNKISPLPSEYKVECPLSEFVSDRIICLPLFIGLSNDDQDRIIEIILDGIS